MNTGSLTVLFEDPFWIDLFEMTDHEGLHVCKVTFGAEPTEKEVMEFVDKNWHRLQYSQAVDNVSKYWIGHMVTAVTVTVFLCTLGLAGENIKAHRGETYG